MLRKKLIVFSLILILTLITIGTACASDNTTQDILSDNEKTFNDITKKIENAKDNDEIILDGKYVSQGKEIKVNKKLTITGKKNTVLDGNKKSRIITADKELTLKNLTFMNTHTTRNKGSAIYANSGLTLINCVFINNIVSDEYSFQPCCVNAYGKSLNIVNCTFKNNKGDSSVISSYSNKITVKDSTFEKNSGDSIIVIDNGNYESQITLSNTKFLNNPKSYAVSSDVGVSGTITNCEFTKNKIAISNTLRLNIKNSKFNKNQYGIMGRGEGDLVTIEKCSFTNNTKFGIYLESGSTITNTKFISNKVAFKSECSIMDFLDTVKLPVDTFKNCIFKSNTNGAIYTTNNLKIVKTTFEGNKGEIAGAINSKNDVQTNKIRILHSTFKNNNADYAGAIRASGADVAITNTTFKNNPKASIVVTHASTTFDGDHYMIRGKLTIDSKKYDVPVNLNHKMKKVKLVKVTTKKVKTSYKSGKKLTIKLINRYTKKPVKNSEITLKIITGKKAKYYFINTNGKGIINFGASSLPVGTHKARISCEYGLCKIPIITTTVEVTKAKTIVKAPKVTNHYGKSEYFKITVKNKVSNQVSKNVALNVKIDGKTYNIKTNAKGIASLNTAKLNTGTHKVTITSKNPNYSISAKSSIIIK